MLSDEEDNLIDFLEEEYGCHTVILYGSRALGISKPDSDWDVLCLTRRTSKQQWCNQQVPGVGEVNAYIYPEEWAAYKPQSPSPIFQPLAHFVRLRHGRVLVEELGWGEALVTRAKQVHAQGPAKRSLAWHTHMEKHYRGYFLQKIGNENLPLMHRQMLRAQMLSTVLESYFIHRGLWSMRGMKDSLIYLEAEDPQAFRAFEAALMPDAGIDALRALVDTVWGVPPVAIS